MNGVIWLELLMRDIFSTVFVVIGIVTDLALYVRVARRTAMISHAEEICKIYIFD